MNLAEIIAFDDETKTLIYRWGLAPRNIFAHEVDRGLGFKPWPKGRYVPTPARRRRLRQDGLPFQIIMEMSKRDRAMTSEEVSLLFPELPRVRVQVALTNLVEMKFVTKGDTYGASYWLTIEGKEEASFRD